jgi:hypothetical protein
MRAVRAAIVVPGLFALCDQVIGNLQMATFAAFGGFATLVLAGFQGTRRDKLIAHSGLALAGSVLVVIGTAVNGTVVLAAIVTVPVTFAVFFAGVAGPNAASGVTGALLAYVLPAASPGTIAMVPDRLLGWWMASVAGTISVLLLSPPPGGSRLRAAAAKLARTLADEIDAVVAHGRCSESQLSASLEAKNALIAEFTTTPFRPTGLAAADQALANAVELLEWCTSLLVDSVHERSDLSDAAPEDRGLLTAAAGVLRDSATLFSLQRAHPDLESLDRHRRASMARIGDLHPASDGFREQTQVAFHADAIAVSVLAIGADALVAARQADAEWIADARTRWFGSPTRGPGDDRELTRGSRYRGIAVRHASVRSVWFINSLRGALALAAAVTVADLSSVQHGFWVVLGTLSVLRTSAASTGSTAMRALLGTLGGFLIGAGLLAIIGTTSAALWVALPIAVLIAAYAPGAAPFAVGQAAFTVVVAVLFNLLVPVGWKVGALRVEDVAIGCAVSVIVGSLFWPHGVAAVVGDDLADAYRSGARYLTQAVEWVCGLREARPDGAMGAVTAGLRLDEALRGFLAEQGTKHVAKEELWHLVGGSLRLRLTAHAVAGLPQEGSATVDEARAVLRHRAAALDDWYERLAAQLGRPRGQPVAELMAPEFDGGVPGESRTRRTIWLCEHLDHLTEHLDELIAPAARLAAVRRRPWWR